MVNKGMYSDKEWKRKRMLVAAELTQELYDEFKKFGKQKYSDWLHEYAKGVQYDTIWYDKLKVKKNGDVFHLISKGFSNFGGKMRAMLWMNTRGKPHAWNYCDFRIFMKVNDKKEYELWITGWLTDEVKGMHNDDVIHLIAWWFSHPGHKDLINTWFPGGLHYNIADHEGSFK